MNHKDLQQVIVPTPVFGDLIKGGRFNPNGKIQYSVLYADVNEDKQQLADLLTRHTTPESRDAIRSEMVFAAYVVSEDLTDLPLTAIEFWGLKMAGSQPDSYDPIILIRRWVKKFTPSAPRLKGISDYLRGIIVFTVTCIVREMYYSELREQREDGKEVTLRYLPQFPHRDSILKAPVLRFGFYDRDNLVEVNPDNTNGIQKKWTMRNNSGGDTVLLEIDGYDFHGQRQGSGQMFSGVIRENTIEFYDENRGTKTSYLLIP